MFHAFGVLRICLTQGYKDFLFYFLLLDIVSFQLSHLGLWLIWSWFLCAVWGKVLRIDSHLFLHHLLKWLSFHLLNYLVKNRLTIYICGSISIFSFLFQWSTCLSLWQWHMVWLLRHWNKFWNWKVSVPLTLLLSRFFSLVLGFCFSIWILAPAVYSYKKEIFWNLY